jgi:uncharacterized protein YjbI with pentapeptide repeats
MTKEELTKILENHGHWLREDCKDWKTMRANLYGANLRNANLRDADLRGANLMYADLYGADLYGANLHSANLRDADLRGANLSDADLSGANMQDADLSGANMHGADLSDADLRGAKNVPFVPYACPDFGMFIGFKKARGYIVVLEIPEDAKRLSATGRECRCDKAKVLSIQNIDGSEADIKEVTSDYDNTFVYKVGEIVKVDNFNEDRWKECSPGIHFFINRQEAVEY